MDLVIGHASHDIVTSLRLLAAVEISNQQRGMFWKDNTASRLEKVKVRLAAWCSWLQLASQPRSCDVQGARMSPHTHAVCWFDRRSKHWLMSQHAVCTCEPPPSAHLPTFAWYACVLYCIRVVLEQPQSQCMEHGGFSHSPWLLPTCHVWVCCQNHTMRPQQSATVCPRLPALCYCELDGS